MPKGTRAGNAKVRGSVVQNDVDGASLIRVVAGAVFDQPSFLACIMKFTRSDVVPIISASVSWILAALAPGSPASRQQQQGERAVFAGVEQLIDQVAMRMFRVRMCERNRSNAAL